MHCIRKNTYCFFLLLIAFAPLTVDAQNFIVNGDASSQGGGCYELTPNSGDKTGSIWSPNKVSLTESFIVTGRMNFGQTQWWAPRAADGIAFALQPVSSTASSSGGGMGVQGINPAMVVEFDHYENSAWGDPTYHHAAITRNGEPDHIAFPPLDGPTQINPGSNSVTDGQWYDYKFEWDVTTQTFTVDINCQQILSYTGDMIQDIFGGISDVHWGFSSATGNKFSQHQVCVDATNLFEMPDQSICLGDTATVALESVGVNYTLNSWNPTTGIIDHTAPNATFSPTKTTEYVVTFTDECNESITDTFNLTVEAAPIVELGNDTSLCGAQNITLDAGNTGSTYLWNTGETSQTINTTGAGTYFVRVTNPTGCEGHDTIVVSTGGSLTVDLGNDSVFCAQVNLTMDAQNSGSTYLWNDGSSNQTLAASSAGMYFIEVTSASGCKGYDTLTITQTTGLTVNLGKDTSICSGESITIDANNPGSSFIWNTGETSQTISPNVAGTYGLTVTDASGCQGSDSIVLTTNPVPTVNLGNNLTICAGTTTSVDAGNAGSTFLWSSGETTQTISSNAAGKYYVDVTSNGCTASDTIEISVSNTVVDLGNDTTICTGSSLTLDAGNPGAGYLWNNAATSQSITVGTAGTYFVDVTNNDGCLGTDSVEVTIGNLTVSLGPDTALCAGEPFSLNATTAGSTYLWSTGATSPIIDASNAMEYSVIVTSASGCEGKDTVAVSAKAGPIISIGNDTTICNGSTLTLDAGSGVNYNYLWSSSASSQTIQVSTGGTYFVEVTVAGSSCLGKDTIDVQISNNLSVNLGNDTTICGTDVMTVSTGIAGNHLWSNGEVAGTININSAGTYYVDVTDANNCLGTDTIKVSQGIQPLVNLGNDTSSCATINIIVDAQNPGATYLWSSGATSQTINVVSTGVYFVDVTNTDNCTTRDSLEVIGATSNLTVDLGPDSTFCGNIFYTRNAGNPGSTYEWNTGESTQSINIASAGEYHVKVTSSANCIATDTIVIKQGSPVTVDLGVTQNICTGEAVILDAGNPGATYLWNDGSTGQTLTAFLAGNYSVAVTNSDNCTDYDDVDLNVGDIPVIQMNNSTNIACPGDTVYVTTGNTTDNHLWSNGSTKDTAMITSNHDVLTVTLTNALGCTNTGAALPVTFSNVSVDLNDIHYHCSGATTIINPNSIDPNFVYNWDTPGGTQGGGLSTSTDGQHVVTALLDIGNKFCEAKDSTTLVSLDYPSLEVIGDTNACEGDYIVIEAISSDDITWSNGSAGSQNTVTVTDTYFAYASKTSNGKTCATADSIKVTFDEYPEEIETEVFEHCFEYDQITTVFTNIIGEHYEWSHSISTAPIAGVSVEGTYSVKVYNNEKCSVSQEIVVEEKCPISLYIPNAFSPNSDGINETFQVIGHNAETYELTIFNRWGEVVFNSTDGNSYWNGSTNGIECQEDVYVWKAKITGYDENYQYKEINKNGTVTLIR